MGEVDLANASDLVAGTLGLALLLVLVSPLWDALGSLYVDLASKDTVDKIHKQVDVAPELALRLLWSLALLALLCYPATAALYLLAQLHWNVAPYRILWQINGAAIYAIPKLRREVEEAAEDEPKEVREWLLRWATRTQLVAAAMTGVLIWITDQGSQQAQRGAVVFTIWVLTLGSARIVLVEASRWLGERRQNSAGAVSNPDSVPWAVEARFGLPAVVWIGMTFVYTVTVIALVSRTLAPL